MTGSGRGKGNNSNYFDRSEMACNLLRHCKLCNLSTRIVNSLTSRNIHSSSNEKADIVISGGGMVGTAMACALGTGVLYNQ